MVQTTMFSPSPRALQLNFHFSPSLATNQKLFSRGLVRINTKAMFGRREEDSKPVLKDGALSIGGKDALIGSLITWW
ncbi:hypothetical protein TorRG33x02_139850 [Trema orientale]|uniref:Uncharacterized protein n=1 Tax=Trema orientale TaxID=63057 RepID=A0A2P5EXR7_TREOI|nr:hypothetical protein TorRG33x02_139850 [Trema orientale]